MRQLYDLERLLRDKHPSSVWWQSVCPSTGLTYIEMLSHWRATKCWGCLFPLQEALDELEAA